ncbi:hypothetical protein [Achromobacter arsenitoxydans]|uniref:Uncharacterized protein n=1 Tax=Achromobacter arsenitoxydans SY8 TaxID=477184 RepID=H0FEP3_9BURK|nr:hypothetical protein [Achromobacter arsenitoxydans]EHK63279.1 hypothetical protein KYC_26287 [Achromobacter arsenitoxydans SY8]
MAIDGEPKNGDFARYIENLTRAGGAAPGRASDTGSARREAPTAPGSLSDAPWGNTAPPPLQSRTAPGATAPAQADEGTVSLARHARQRKIGVVLTIAGMLAGWAAVNIGFRALHNPRFDMDEMIPAIFLAFFAFMLFKAASGARNPRKTPLEKLPPLTPSSYRKDGG